jgi:hypothetical protein
MRKNGRGPKQVNAVPSSGAGAGAGGRSLSSLPYSRGDRIVIVSLTEQVHVAQSAAFVSAPPEERTGASISLAVSSFLLLLATGHLAHSQTVCCTALIWI